MKPNVTHPEELNRNQNNPKTQGEVPGDTDAPDIVGRTGEEMPAVAHDQGRDEEIVGDDIARDV